jgi:excisionase family DNA binding protein
MRAHGKNQPKGTDRLLSVGDVARRLRVSVDVVRSLTESGQLKAVRTSGRHRRYKPEDVERYRTRGRAAAHARQVEPATKRQRPVYEEPGEPEFEEDHPTFEELEAEEARQAARQRSRAEEERLEGWKKRGRELATYTGLPSEWRVKVIENLEDFVTTKRIPPTLAKSEVELIVQAQVNSFVKRYWEDIREGQQKERDAAEARSRADEERRQKEREAEEQRRKREEDERRLKALIAHGLSHARWETMTGWDREERERMLRDVERELKDEVKVDWSEANVTDLVDDILEEDDDDDGDDEYEEHEEDEKEEGDESL